MIEEEKFTIIIDKYPRLYSGTIDTCRQLSKKHMGKEHELTALRTAMYEYTGLHSINLKTGQDQRNLHSTQVISLRDREN